MAVSPLLVALSLIAAPPESGAAGLSDVYSVFSSDDRPSLESPIQSQSGLRHFLPSTADRLTRAQAVDRRQFDRWLVRNNLAAVRNRADARHYLPTVLARGDAAKLARYGRVEATSVRGVYKVRLGPGIVDPVSIAQRLARDATWAEPDEWIRYDLRGITFDDPFYPAQWHLHQTTNPRVAVGINIRADLAWEITQGETTRPIIGVLDDGFGMGHPDLVPQFMTNESGTLAYDYADNDPDPTAHADDGHGTKVAGVAAGRGNNGIGISGVCPQCRLIPLRIFSSGNDFNPTQLYGPMSVAADAMRYAADNGARVINNSWGPSVSPTNPSYQAMPAYVKDTITDLVRRGTPEGSAGVLVVWAAGNNPGQVTSFDGWVSDPRTLAVGALNSVGSLAAYSNIGPQIRIMAPSSDAARQLPYITSADGDDDYIQTFGGTSAAAPIVAGTAALVLSKFPTLTLAQLFEVLLDSANKVTPDAAKYGRNGQSCTRGFGMVDARGALDLAAARADVYASGRTEHFELCGDGIDNDANPATPDACTVCIPTQARELMNGVDDDCDGYIDNPAACVPSGHARCETCLQTSECQIDMECLERSDGKRCLRTCAAENPCVYNEACVSGVCLPIKDNTPVECGAYSPCVQSNDGIELCDNIDNDCNGTVDDVASESPSALSAEESCNRDQVGECASKKPVCTSGAWTCSEPQSTVFEPNETLCDTLDNDCDGVIDEECPVEPPPKKPGQCSSLGLGEAWPALLAFLLLRARYRSARSLRTRSS
jgi:hypothetical protein